MTRWLRGGRPLVCLLLVFGVIGSTAPTGRSAGAAQPPAPRPVPEAYVKAANADANDWFGARVAIDGDTMVVGASNESGIPGEPSSNSLVRSGAAYVYVRRNGAWTQQAYLKAPNADAEDWFGTSVAISGDTLAVGAISEDSAARGVNGDMGDNSRPNSGAVYVFARSGGTWTLQSYLKASNADAGDGFGSSIALEADTLVVGATGESSAARAVNGDQTDNNAEYAGAAYVFVRSGTTWSQQAYLKAANADPRDYFASDVSLSGDRLAVGAAYEDSDTSDPDDNSAEAAGAAYVFVRSGTTWSQQAYLKPTRSHRDQHFGGSVALDGDALAIGASGESFYLYSGAAYVFGFDGAAWNQRALIALADPAREDYFGSSVALDKNILAISGWGRKQCSRWLLGAPQESCVDRGGATYVYARDGATWRLMGGVHSARPATHQGFGSLALSGETLAVGSVYESGGDRAINGAPDRDLARGTGAVFVYGLPTGAPELAVNRADTLAPLSNGDAAPAAASPSLGFSQPGRPITVTFNIHNLGPQPLALDGAQPAAISNDAAGAFAIAAQPAGPVPGGEASALTIRFTPPASGAYTATLTLASADADEGAFSVTLRGLGLAGKTYLPLLNRPPYGETNPPPGRGGR